MQSIRSYKELRVYQAAIDAAMRIFEVTKRFPLKSVFQWSTKCDEHRDRSAPILAKLGASGAIPLTFAASSVTQKARPRKRECGSS